MKERFRYELFGAPPQTYRILDVGGYQICSLGYGAFNTEEGARFVCDAMNLWDSLQKTQAAAAAEPAHRTGERRGSARTAKPAAKKKPAPKHESADKQQIPLFRAPR